MPKTKDTATVTEETTEVETAIITEDVDDGGETSDLDAIFETSIEATGLEEDGGEDGDVKAGESTTVETEGEATTEAGDDKTKAETDIVAEPEVAATVEEPAKEKPVVEQPTVEPPTPPDSTKVLADYQEWRGQAEELLASQHYALTSEQAEEFDTDPGTAIPKLAAKLHMEVMQQSVAMIAGLLPKIMANVNVAQTQETARETAFFKEWPELTEHRDQVVRLGAVYYQMNPQASFDEFVRDVGAQTAVSMKVDLSGRQAAVEETPKMKAHRPISAGGGSGGASPGKKLGVFEELDADAEAFDQG